MKINIVIIMSLLLFISSCMGEWNKKININVDDTKLEQWVNWKDFTDIKDTWDTTLDVENIIKDKDVVDNDKKEILTSKKKEILEKIVKITKQESKEMFNFTSIDECNSLRYKKTECRDTFLLNFAEKEKLIFYCKKLSTQQLIDACKDNISYVNKNCAFIKNTALKKECEENNETYEKKKIVQVQEQERLIQNNCSNIKGFAKRYSCAQIDILQTLNIDLCKIYFSWEEQFECYTKVNYSYDKAVIKKAFWAKDLTICNKAYSSSVRESCKQMTF